MIVDNHGRPLNYLRLAVTDRCNLRCFYCMPEHGMKFLPRAQVLSYEEMLRLCSILAKNGVNKVRITGGEPFVRKDMDYFLTQLSKVKGVEHLYVTTNGVLTGPYISILEQLKFKGVNLSLDSVSSENFKRITKRDVFEDVMQVFNQLVASSLRLKINVVVMQGYNEHEIVDMARLAERHAVEVRFIEEMPFNGTKRDVEQQDWNWKRIFGELQGAYPDLHSVATERDATARKYVSGHLKGSLGIIPAFSRTFCGTCNRIRITASGQLKTCLYDNGVLNLKTLLTTGSSDHEIERALTRAFNNRASDGFEAQSQREQSGIEESMATIGG